MASECVGIGRAGGVLPSVVGTGDVSLAAEGCGIDVNRWDAQRSTGWRCFGHSVGKMKQENIDCSGSSASRDLQ